MVLFLLMKASVPLFVPVDIYHSTLHVQVSYMRNKFQDSAL